MVVTGFFAQCEYMKEVMLNEEVFAASYIQQQVCYNNMKEVFCYKK